MINRKLVATLLLALITVIGMPTAARAITAANGDFEAETVTSGLNKQVLIKSDSAASGGKNVTMLINGTISKTVITPNVTALKVTAKGNQCSGAPLMTVKIDGTAVMSNIAVSATSYTGYNSPSLTSVKSGTHTVAISFTNDYYNSSTNCDRNLIVDKVEFTPGTT
ncbi:MAG: carbohydrate-binding domain-containing protein, partial [Candidatus Saccharimonadales bacterium]